VGCLCKLALPSAQDSTNNSSSSSSSSSSGSLTGRHIQILSTLLRIVHRLGNVLGEHSWHSCLDIIDQVCHMHADTVYHHCVELYKRRVAFIACGLKHLND
jgi:hypothetical protein